MTTTLPVATTATMLPYHRQGDIDYACLDFDPHERELPPDAMEQELAVHDLLNLLASHFTDFGARPDTFLSSNTILCYDPSNLNVRVAPDVYLAFGVDERAIRQRRLYLPWEVGKPPDLAVEVASASTARQDVTAKRDIYARIGVPEYWRFDPTGHDYYDRPLAGEQLVDGVYQPIALTREPDGILKGYSAVLRLSLCWAGGRPRLYDPATNTYLDTGVRWRPPALPPNPSGMRPKPGSLSSRPPAWRSVPPGCRSRLPARPPRSEYGSLRRSCVAAKRTGKRSHVPALTLRSLIPPDSGRWRPRRRGNPCGCPVHRPGIPPSPHGGEGAGG